LCEARRACGCVTPHPGCEGEERASCERWLECAAWPPGDGDWEIDEGALTRCVRAASSELSSCRGAELPGECYALLAQPVEVGAPCHDPYGPCRGGRCDRGVCAPLPGEGEACFRVCAPGLRCNWEARCAPDAAGLECGRSLDCPPALSCVDERCAAPAERCDHDEACGVGEACRDGRCQGVERCRLDGECGRERRCGGEVVERCGLEPPEPWLLPEGEPCDHTAGCREGLVCD
ncbi:MAG TPA: hypothetical protein DEF51_16270, partial [Myxococcales bacterium]|nr:hypothetical protein [Myxococcales bacterium]